MTNFRSFAKSFDKKLWLFYDLNLKKIFASR